MNIKIDEARYLLREFQSMLFQENVDIHNMFSKTVEMDNILNIISIEYNKYLNDKKITN